MGAKTRRNFRFCVASDLVYVHRVCGGILASNNVEEEQLKIEQRRRRQEQLDQEIKLRNERALEASQSVRLVEQSKQFVCCSSCKRSSDDKFGSSDELNWFRVGQCTGYCRKCSRPDYLKNLGSYGCCNKYNPTGKLMFCNKECWLNLTTEITFSK